MMNVLETIILVILLMTGALFIISSVSPSIRVLLRRTLFVLLLIILPLITAILIAVVGFLIEFSSCFMKSCSVTGLTEVAIGSGIAAGIVEIYLLIRFREKIMSMMQKHPASLFVCGALFLSISLLTWYFLYGIEGSSIF